MQGVADGDDPGGERDRVAAEAVRVAGAVVALVDGADERRDVVQQRDALQERGADRGVLLDLLELRGREASRLGEDLGANADLADVVQERGVAQRAQLGVGEAERAAGVEREVGDHVGVVGGVGVLGLQDVGEDPERGGEGGLQLLGQPRAVQRGADLGGDGVGEQEVVVAEGVGGELLEVQDAPDRAVDVDREATARSRGRGAGRGAGSPGRGAVSGMTAGSPVRATRPLTPSCTGCS